MLRYYFNSVIYLFNRWVLRKNYLTAYSPKFDLHFKFKTEDVIGRLIYKRGTYEESLTNFLLNYVKFYDKDIIIDIGANIGWYATLLSKFSPNSVKVYAFEPDPLNYSLLKDNIKLNEVKVIAYQQAVSDKNGSQILYQYPSKNQGRHSLLPINSNHQVQVTTVCLDDFFNSNKLNFSDLKFIKIDIEGYEYFALKGAEQCLKHVPYILSEYSPSLMRKGNLSPGKLLDLLCGFSFIPFLVEYDKLIETSQEELLAMDYNVNVFWKKKHL